ncbi:hypothetical protein RKD39_001749 [Streptomyces albogriseolus]
MSDLYVGNVRLRLDQGVAGDDNNAFIIGARSIVRQLRVQRISHVRANNRKPAVGKLKNVGTRSTRSATSEAGSDTEAADDLTHC